MPRLNVLVYNGYGVSKASLKQTMHSLEAVLSRSHDIQTIDAKKMQGPWEDTCAMFVMPGGRDIPYVSGLGSHMISRIRDYVYNGGTYFGICAGAYFAARRIIFKKGRPDYEIIADRQLGLFPGTARGSVYPGFEYESEDGATAAKVIVNIPDEYITYCYFNGGCQFEIDGGNDGGWDIIGRYAENGEPAIISSTHGKGAIILSGVHPEYDPFRLDSDVPPNVRRTLVDNEQNRSRLWKSLLLKAVEIVNYEGNVEESVPIKCVFGATGLFEDSQCNELFSSSEYSKHLRTQNFGKVVLFTPKIHSTQSYLQESIEVTNLLPTGTALVAGEQLQGRGRGNNKWISPPQKASLMFTFVVRHSCSQTLSMLQCITSASMVKAIRSFNEAAQVYIKWPNDVYIRDLSQSLHKVGGVLVSSSIYRDTNVVLIGCGVNVGPCDKLSSLADILTKEEGLPRPESLLARFFNEFEKLYNELDICPDNVVYTYLDLWLHSGQEVFVESEGKSVIIQGIDEFGYLLGSVINSNETIKLQPDGNSFDMMKKLIKIK